MRSRSWPTTTFDAAVRPQAKRCGLEDVDHAMVHCQRMGEVDLGVNKDECCGKHHQNRGTDLENKRGGRSRQLLSSHGHDGIPNGSSKTKKTRRTSSPREPTGSALLAANKFVTDSHPCARTQSRLAVTKAVTHSSALMLAARITLAQRSDSTLMTAANSSGGIRHRHETDGIQALFHVGQCHAPHDFPVQQIDDLIRRSGRNQHAEQGVGLLAGKSRFRDRRYIGQRGGALSAQDSEPTQACFPDVRYGWREDDEGELRVATESRLGCWR